MWYSVGTIITLREDTLLSSGILLKNHASDHVKELINKDAVIILLQPGISKITQKYYCHYKLEVLIPSKEKYIKVLHTDNMDIKKHIRNIKLNNLLE